MQSNNMHNFYQRSIQLITLLLLSIALVACGGSERQSGNQNNAANPPSVAQAQEAGEVNETGATVNVIARDFEFLLDSNTASAGTVTFVVTNEGSMPHDFAIDVGGERHQTAMLQPGSSASLTVELQSGSYEYICTVPGHDILGMKGTFTVN